MDLGSLILFFLEIIAQSKRVTADDGDDGVEIKT